MGGYVDTERYPKGHDKYGEIVYDKDGNPSKVLNPNWVKNYITKESWDDLEKTRSGRSDYRKGQKESLDKTIETEQQPLINAQIARVLMAYKNFKTYPTTYIESFSDLFCE